MTTTAESPILVLGATGGQGGAVTAALLARQARVRAMVRRPGEPSVQRLTERGVEVMVGSFDDRAAIGAAMEGAAAVFALAPLAALAQQPIKIFDSHLHYNGAGTNAFFTLDQVLDTFRSNGIAGIVANSRPNRGTQQLV